MFVAPGHLRGGVCRAMMVHATAEARRLGGRLLLIEADANAEGFYLGFGAKRIGEVASQSKPGRRLPLLSLALLSRAL